MGELLQEVNGRYAVGEDGFTQDGTVDLKGRPVLRSATGRWKACTFLVGYEVFERMSYYGIASNLVVYLTKMLHEGTVTSANNVTNWVGTVWMTPILGAYIADAHLGRYWTFVVASAVYLSGMSLLTLSVSLPKLKPLRCDESPLKPTCANKTATDFQKGMFYSALYIIAIGTGGTKPNISTIGADQFDDFEPKERKMKLSFFNWWMFSIFFGTLFSNTVLVYLQDNIGWTLGYGLPTLGLAFSITMFLVGTKFYRHKVVCGSPVTKMAQVLVASVRNWKVVVPNDSTELHELGSEEYGKLRKVMIDHTLSLRFLDKAAVRTGRSVSAWSLCPVTQVEETKQMVKMLPILLTQFIPSAVMSQVSTLFIKQGITLDRSIGPNFKIPPASLSAFVTIFMLTTLALYDRILTPFVRKYTKNPRGFTMLQRLGTGLFLHSVIMITSCLVEMKKLSVAKKLGISNNGEIVPLSIFILLPQFALFGVADAFECVKLEFFYDQAPESMKSLGTSYFTSSVGIGSFLSSFLLKTVSNSTRRNGGRGWFSDNLNECRFDYYYGFLAVLSFVNFLVYLAVCRFYRYNSDFSESEKVSKEAVRTFPNTTDGT